MNKHPHEEVILAYYRGEEIEARSRNDGEWREVKRYNECSTSAPTFHSKAQYRIKPKTHTVELTQEEVEALIVVCERVGGNPEKTARRHTGSARDKLIETLPWPEAGEIINWSMAQSSLLNPAVDGSVVFRTEIRK